MRLLVVALLGAMAVVSAVELSARDEYATFRAHDYPKIRQKTGIDNIYGVDVGGPLPLLDYSRHSQAVWKKCKGDRQSPINLEPARSQKSNIKLKTQFAAPDKAKLTHAGVGMAIFPDKKMNFGTFLLNGEEFTAHEIHFHNPSEHVFDGKRAKMEMQVVGRAGSKLMIMSVLFNIGGTNDFLRDLGSWTYDKFKSMVPGKSIKISGQVNLNKLSELSEGPWLTYEGSATRPPCVEPITWIVGMRIAPISADQMAGIAYTMKKMFKAWSGHPNYRELQATNRRPLYLIEGKATSPAVGGGKCGSIKDPAAKLACQKEKKEARGVRCASLKSKPGKYKECMKMMKEKSAKCQKLKGKAKLACEVKARKKTKGKAKAKKNQKAATKLRAVAKRAQKAAGKMKSKLGKKLMKKAAKKAKGAVRKLKKAAKLNKKGKTRKAKKQEKKAKKDKKSAKKLKKKAKKEEKDA